MPKIEVTISGMGELKVDAIGFKNNSCIKATEFLKKLGQVESTNKKPEFFQEKVTIQKGSIYEG